VTGDKAIRTVTALVVTAVAAFAAVVSYSHIYDLARSHGETGAAARLLPLSVDGLILAASLLMLHEARAGRDAPRLAQLCLVAGVLATLGANIMFGAKFGPVGAMISAWPAASFIGSAELLMLMIRRSRTPAPVPAASNGHDPAVQQFRPWLERGEVPGVKTIKSELGVGPGSESAGGRFTT